MSLQVLHYAAQVKLLTQKRIVRTGHAILTLPSDMADYAVEVIQEAHRMIVSMQEQVRTIRRRQRARRQQKTRQLTRMKRQTIAGTSTSTSTSTEGEEQNNENIDMMEETHTHTHTPRASASASASASSPSYDMEQISHIPTAPAPAMPAEIKDAKKLETLTEQIRALKEQMELFAKAKQTDIASRSPATAPAPATSTSAPPTPPPFIPDAPRCDIPIAPPLNDDIPMAPPMDDVTMQNPFTPFTPVRLMNNISESSSCTSPIPLASLSSPSTTSSSSSSTPVSTSSSSNTSSPDKENVTSSAPSSSQQRTPFRNVSNITCNHGTPGNTNVPQIKLKSITTSEGANGAAVKLRPTPQSGLKRVFTRRIPGADVLTHNDLIKVSAKIKLRKTNVPRSPGGTPRKECANNDPFANALFHKFKNVHGESSRRSIPSLVVPPAKRHSRTSFGKREDEDEESWNTA